MTNNYLLSTTTDFQVPCYFSYSSLQLIFNNGILPVMNFFMICTMIQNGMQSAPL